MKLIYIDLFCGAGGTSTGVESARVTGQSVAFVAACVNHDANAIASHAANHPLAKHYIEDIRTLDLTELVSYIASLRVKYPEAKLVLWASLECTNFSKAKGGQPRDADSRTLAEHLFRYIEQLNPDYVQIENVEEFMSWGDLDENGKPISRDAGRLYRLWVDHVKSYGYAFDHRILNSADFGAYTSRKRFFGIFAKYDLPIVFPEPTHTKAPVNGLFGSGLQKWKPVREVLDLSDEGESIFGRKKSLVDATLERIYAGLIKFVAGGKQRYLIQYNAGKGRNARVKSVDDPSNVVTTHNRFGLVQAQWMLKYNSVNGKTRVHNPPSIEEPCPVVSCQGRLGLFTANFLSKYFSGNPDSKNGSIEAPAGAITTRDHHSLVGVKFLSAYYGNGHNHSVNSPAPTVTTKDRLACISPKFICSYNYKDQPRDIDSPCPTILTKDRFACVSPCFIDQQFGNSKPISVNNPLGCITTNPKYNLVHCKPWIMNTSFSNVGSDLDQPAQTITANRKWHYLMNPQFASKGSDINRPCFTLIARMDKMPPYLIRAENGAVNIRIEDADTLAMIKIKEFMALYGIVDIKMRMLKIPELKMIMGFPKDYVLIGTQAEQKKYIGNAVEVTMARVLCECLVEKLSKTIQNVA